MLLLCIQLCFPGNREGVRSSQPVLLLAGPLSVAPRTGGAPPWRKEPETRGVRRGRLVGSARGICVVMLEVLLGSALLLPVGAAWLGKAQLSWMRLEVVPLGASCSGGRFVFS